MSIGAESRDAEGKHRWDDARQERRQSTAKLLVATNREDLRDASPKLSVED